MVTISQSYGGIVGIFELSCKIMMDITLTIATLVLYDSVNVVSYRFIGFMMYNAQEACNKNKGNKVWVRK